MSTEAPVNPALAELRDSVDCAVCYRILFQPISLGCCGSSFCRSCLRRHLTSASGGATCPLCRGYLGRDPAALRPNVVLSRIISAYFPGELVGRREEDQAAELDLSLQRLALVILPPSTFDGSDVDFRLPRSFPGAPFHLVVPPQYAPMMEHCAEDEALFGLQPSVSSPHGVAIRIESIERTGNERFVVKGRAMTRYRVTGALRTDEAVSGRTHSAPAEFYEDTPIAGSPQAALTGVGDAPTLPLAHTAWTRVPPPVRRALLRMESDHTRALLLRDVVAATLVRLVAAVPRNASHDVTSRYGDHPPATGPQGSPEQWSLYAAGFLGLPPADKIEAFTTRYTLQRLLLVYGFLVDAERRTVASTGCTPDDDDDAMTRHGHRAPTLEDFPNISPVHALDFYLAAQYAAVEGSGGVLLRRARALMAHPLASSIAVMLGVALLIYLVAKDRGTHSYPIYF